MLTWCPLFYTQHATARTWHYNNAEVMRLVRDHCSMWPQVNKNYRPMSSHSHNLFMSASMDQIYTYMNMTGINSVSYTIYTQLPNNSTL